MVIASGLETEEIIKQEKVVPLKIAFYGDSLTEAKTGASFFEILRKKLPEHRLINHGRGGDTVISLFRRIVRKRLTEPVDVAFLWVGVNDVLVHVSWKFPIVKWLSRKPWARDAAEFGKYYRSILDILSLNARTIYAVSPLCIGEDLGNPWNRQLDGLRDTIETVSSAHEHVAYIDMKEALASKLKDAHISDYVVHSLVRVSLDAFLLNTDEKVDICSSTRGLKFTLDGVHLNSRGASMVADVFYQEINARLSRHTECVDD
jgi:lysophospholipase L1-like esterase